jgi:hypothetical protein
LGGQLVQLVATLLATGRLTHRSVWPGRSQQPDVVDRQI